MQVAESQLPALDAGLADLLEEQQRTHVLEEEVAELVESLDAEAGARPPRFPSNDRS